VLSFIVLIHQLFQNIQVIFWIVGISVLLSRQIVIGDEFIDFSF